VRSTPRSVALIATLSGGESPTMKLMAESATTPPLETARSTVGRVLKTAIKGRFAAD
jgi:hypothetical protein